MATPTICRPCGPYFFCRSTSQGISILQGPHQVAQKLSSTALPCREAIGTTLPSGMLFNSNVGASDPLTGSPEFCSNDGAAWPSVATFTLAAGGLLAFLPTSKSPVITTTTARIKMTFLFTNRSSQGKAV